MPNTLLNDIEMAWDYIQGKKKKVKKKAKKKRKVKSQYPIAADHDSDGRPIGIGGARRRRKIDDIVEEMETGRKKE